MRSEVARGAAPLGVEKKRTQEVSPEVKGGKTQQGPEEKTERLESNL